MRDLGSRPTLPGMDSVLLVVSIIVVVVVLALAAWVFVLAPFVVPYRHLRH